jgi:hypothetical protein
MPVTGGSGPDAAAWLEFCERVAAVGDEIERPPFPAGDRARAEGFAHLAEQAVCWLGWEVFHADPRTPFFHRQNDLVSQWGGPNVDNVYRHARVEPGRRYRIRGRMNACDDFVLALRRGFMHAQTWGTVREMTASEAGIRPGSEFEIRLGPWDAAPAGGPADATVPSPLVIDIPPETTMVSVREYYFDWRAAEPATFVIECLDAGAERPRPPAATDLAARLSAAAHQIEGSMSFWNGYLRDARAAGPVNAFTPSWQLTKGLSVARYGFCFFHLAPGEALVVDCDVPDARYWSFQLYNEGWFEPMDVVDRVTSLNHTQARIDDDNRVRVVVADTDPGAPNWLDPGGRVDGLLTLRWFWPRGERRPEPTTQVVGSAGAHDLLPAGTPRVDAAARAAQLAARREHLAWRFRT